MTRDLMIAGALVSLVALAFHGALGGHAAPPSGSDGARDLPGMVDPRVTQLDLRDLMPQPRAGACNAHIKDDLERRLSIMVCAGELTLKGAQYEIATDWRAAYKKWFNGKGLQRTVATREAQMRLKLERVNMRRTANEYAICDEVTGNCVATVKIERASVLKNMPEAKEYEIPA